MARGARAGRSNSWEIKERTRERTEGEITNIKDQLKGTMENLILQNSYVYTKGDLIL